MAKNKRFVYLDKEDLEAMIASYADKFYACLSNEGREAACGEEIRDIVKKLAGFIREYEELIKSESEQTEGT